ncbi:DUF6291 domain-containing protein [Alistipes finegoldii]|uniref:DUF6291 domain-containing protein n=1 Tax=Alistipes finegoldii TaxID=214856 RepID=UPI00205E52AF|nr:MAG TPA: hypothetical protein [Caudoviricetes sp.]
MAAIEHTENPSRKTFAFYWSFKDAIRDMPDADKLAVYEAITDFAFFGVDPGGLSPVGRLAWKLIRPQLEASIRRYEACVTNGNKGKEFGKLGGRPRKTPTHNPKEKPQTTTPTHNPLNHNDNDNDNLNGNDKGVIGGEVAAKRAAFVAPSLEIVKDYFSTIKGSDADAECFYDHFTANGWKVSGKSSMKDWKAAARNWMRRKSEFSTTIQKQTNHETKRIYKDL